MTQKGNWEKIQAHLERIRLTLEKGAEPDADVKANILRKRAEELAKEAESLRTENDYCDVVEFLLGHEKYAIELRYIREVYPLKEITPIPCTPDFVMGIVNFRGQLLSIINLKKFFELPDQPLLPYNRIIVLHSDTMEFGIFADIVIGVRSILLSDIQTALPTLTEVQEKYLKGVVKKDRMVILNGEKILSDKELIVHQGTDD